MEGMLPDECSSQSGVGGGSDAAKELGEDGELGTGDWVYVGEDLGV